MAGDVLSAELPLVANTMTCCVGVRQAVDVLLLTVLPCIQCTATQEPTNRKVFQQLELRP